MCSLCTRNGEINSKWWLGARERAYASSDFQPHFHSAESIKKCPVTLRKHIGMVPDKQPNRFIYLFVCSMEERWTHAISIYSVRISGLFLGQILYAFYAHGRTADCVLIYVNGDRRALISFIPPFHARLAEWWRLFGCALTIAPFIGTWLSRSRIHIKPHCTYERGHFAQFIYLFLLLQNSIWKWFVRNIQNKWKIIHYSISSMFSTNSDHSDRWFCTSIQVLFTQRGTHFSALLHVTRAHLQTSKEMTSTDKNSNNNNNKMKKKKKKKKTRKMCYWMTLETLKKKKINCNLLLVLYPVHSFTRRSMHTTNRGRMQKNGKSFLFYKKYKKLKLFLNLPNGIDEIGALNGQLNTCNERECRVDDDGTARCTQNDAPEWHLQWISFCCLWRRSFLYFFFSTAVEQMWVHSVIDAVK